MPESPSPSALSGVALTGALSCAAQEDLTAQLLWTLTMVNGDTIRLTQELSLQVVPSYDIYPADAPMETAAELQALIDSLPSRLEPNALVTLHLPAVDYGESLTVRGLSVSLTGSVLEGKRTTFFAPVRVEPTINGHLCQISGIDFLGDGTGTALSTSSDLLIQDCRFSGFATGLLCHGESWTCVSGCVFENNAVGFHFNSAGTSAGRTLYDGNLFRGNDIAVLLEQVPTGLPLDFQDSLFTGNKLDIDNRCGQPLEISRAIFQ